MEVQIFPCGCWSKSQVSTVTLPIPPLALSHHPPAVYCRCEVKIQAGQLQVVWRSGLIRRERCFHPRNILRASPNDGAASTTWGPNSCQVLPLSERCGQAVHTCGMCSCASTAEDRPIFIATARRSVLKRFSA
jgi:hypothetical protein